MTSLRFSIRLMTRASCDDRGTCSVAVTTAVWSGVTPTLRGHDVDLVLGHDLGDVATAGRSGRRPRRGWRSDRSAVGSASHSTSMSRLTSRSLTTVGHAWRWTVTPLPRVMKPTIGSPGIGWQHFAKRTSRSPTPLTRTPPVRATCWGGATVGSVLWPSSTTPRRMTTDWAPIGAVADRPRRSRRRSRS